MKEGDLTAGLPWRGPLRQRRNNDGSIKNALHVGMWFLYDGTGFGEECVCLTRTAAHGQKVDGAAPLLLPAEAREESPSFSHGKCATAIDRHGPPKARHYSAHHVLHQLSIQIQS